MPVSLPSDVVTTRDSLQLYDQIPPFFVTIAPPAAPAGPVWMPVAPVTGRLGLRALFSQSLRTERDKVVPLADLREIGLDL